MDRIAIEQEKIKNLLRNYNTIKDPVKYRVHPSEWLKELTFNRKKDKHELYMEQVLDNLKFRDTFLKFYFIYVQIFNDKLEI